MKIKITLFTLLLSLMSFGQDREYETANSNYKNQNYTEAIAIGEKILQNQYGNVSPILKLYTTFLVADSYKLLNKYPEAINKYKEYLELIKSSSLFNDKIKEKATIDIQKGIDELQSKIVATEKTYSGTTTKQIETETSSAENISTKTETPINPVANTTDTDKTVILTVSSSGKTIEEAKNNALRSAIEQAFGSFISSKTEILNDNIIKDEIVSVANGNIKNYEIVSQVEIPGNGFGVTIKATVSIDKLTSFAESKGIEIEFKGGLFAQNIKLQKINEQSELNACVNIYSVVHELLQKGFDYTVENEDPKLVKDDLYSIEFTVKVKPNENYINAREYLSNSLQKLAMTPEEIESYQKLNKQIYKFKEYNLRNSLSEETLNLLHENSEYYKGNFEINIDDIDVVFGPDLQFKLDYYGMPNDSKLIEPSYLHGKSPRDGDYPFLYNRLETNHICLRPSQCGYCANYEYSWEQQFKIEKIEKMQKISVTSRGVRSKFKYGGFVIYDDGAKIIIAAPYKYATTSDDFSNLGNRGIMSSVVTSEKIFEGKKNMDLLKNDKNIFFELISKFNSKNNTDWHIPTENELILYTREVYGNTLIKFLISNTFKKVVDWENYNTYWITDGSFDRSFLINEKTKKYFQDGRPFNAHEAYDALNGLKTYQLDSYQPIIIPLVKYVTIK